MNTAETLEKAKLRLSQDRWFPGYSRAPEMHEGFAFRKYDCILTVLEGCDNYFECLDLLRKAIQKVDPKVETNSQGLVIVSSWNDTHSYEEVMQVYDTAIALAKEIDNV